MNLSLGDRIWHDHTRRLLPESIRIIGRVVGKVLIRDINRDVSYNRMIDIPISDAKRSADLQNAISKKWVDVVYGKELLMGYNSEKASVPQPQIQPQNQQVQQQSFDVNAIRDIVKDAVSSSITPIAQSLDDIKRLQNSGGDSQAITDAINNLLKNLPTSQQQQVQQHIGDKPSESTSVFIDVEEKNLKTNIDGNLGKVTKQKGRKAKSVVQKLKQFKQGDE